MEKIKGYKLIGKIGKGGMALVYKGIQTSLNRPVAIKILLKKLSNHPEVIERFNRESLIIGRLTNPHIIHVIDRGITGTGQPYFVMEYVEGTDLAALIKKGGLNFNQKLNLCVQMCRAFSYAHKNGVIHRDIKPSNVLIDQDGNVRVLDFGIAQFYGDGTEDVERTQVGTVMGTMPYMSPEQQYSAGDVTALSDQYSFGILMYELFTGLKPMGRFRLPSEIDPEFPQALEEIIMRCVDLEAARRFASIDQIKEFLLKMLRGAHLGSAQRLEASQAISSLEDRFALLDIIKEDEYGTAYLYENRQDHELLVIKKGSSNTTGYAEAKKLTLLKHKNIVNILGASKNERNFIIVMEYLSGGSLKDRLIKPMSIDTFLDIARQISVGLAFVHHSQIIHGNLRPSNIMFTQSGQVRLTDFGLDEHYPPERHMTNWYNLCNMPRSVRGDIFAAGVIFYQMLTGELPKWYGRDLNQPKWFNKLPKALRELTANMLIGKRGPIDGDFDGIVAVLTGLIQQRDRIRKKEEKAAQLAKDKARREKAAREAKKKRRFYGLIAAILLFAGTMEYLYLSDNINLLLDFIQEISREIGQLFKR